MTDQQSHQQPYAGAPGAGYPQQDQIPYGAQQGSYGQAPSQSPYGQAAQNPYAQAPQNPYGQAPANPYGQAPQNPYGPPPKKARLKAALVVRGVIGVVVLGLAVGGYIVKKHNEAGRDDSGNISSKGDVDAFNIHAGDCFKDPGVSSDISSVTGIPCTQPHTAQVVSSFVYPGATDVRPLDSDLQANANPLCDQAVKDKVDESKVPQDAEQSLLVPQGRAWSKGHHDILCIVTSNTEFTGTILK